MKIAEPKAFMIARTAIEYDDIEEALAELGAPEWDAEDAATGSETLIEFAGKLCYMSFDKSLNENLTRTGGKTNAEYIQEQIVKQKHGSVLEHAYVTFVFTNVSRIVTHEIVRHRAGMAFSQVSGRYVRGEPSFYMPLVLRGTHAEHVFKTAVDMASSATREMERVTDINAQSFSMKKMLTSAIRRIIGNGQANHIVVTGNHRSWRHIIAMRTSAGAEEEIRDVIGQVARKLHEQFPAIYEDMIESDVDELGLRTYSFKHEKV